MVQRTKTDARRTVPTMPYHASLGPLLARQGVQLAALSADEPLGSELACTILSLAGRADRDDFGGRGAERHGLDEPGPAAEGRRDVRRDG